jgi:hypothetical protein
MHPLAANELADCGFAIVSRVFDTTECQNLLTALGPVTGAGRRNLLGLPIVSELARSQRLLEIVDPHLPSTALPVRAIYFDKSPRSNWLVAWHQDLTLALRARVETPGFGPWSVKGGVSHVQPPVELLEKMLTLRLHLDDTNAANGALRVLPGSHRHGRLSADEIQKLRAQPAEILCSASAGDVLLMRPLLLHASSRSTSSAHRRILHIEYAAFNLPPGLHWQAG